jgi:hypothetical protein
VRKLTDKVPMLGRMMREPAASGECRLKRIGIGFAITFASLILYVVVGALLLIVAYALGLIDFADVEHTEPITGLIGALIHFYLIGFAWQYVPWKGARHA